ncbi:unnamed protein product [Effrenium voratum]|nr:unnamed protein product [Effrenium voratum]
MRCLWFLLACAESRMVMMYKAKGPDCGQALLPETWRPYAQRLAGLRMGNCPNKGYPVASQMKDMKVPVLGVRVQVQMFKRPAGSYTKTPEAGRWRHMHLVASSHTAMLPPDKLPQKRLQKLRLPDWRFLLIPARHAATSL